MEEVTHKRQHIVRNSRKSKISVPESDQWVLGSRTGHRRLTVTEH